MTFCPVGAKLLPCAQCNIYVSDSQRFGKVIAAARGHNQHRDFLMMKLGKMTVDCSVATEDERSRTVCGVLESVLNFYLDAAASEAIDCLWRYVWMKQRSCDHEEKT